MSGLFVPKLSKNKRDAIVDLIKQGYTHKEIAEKVGVSRNTVGKIKKEMNKEVISHKIDPNTLSTKSIAKLSNIQGLVGSKSLDETVEIIYDDYTTIMPLKYEFDLDFTKTPSEVFKEIVERYKFNKKSLNNILRGKGNTWIQTLVLKSWGMSWSVKALYDIICAIKDFQGSILDFMEKSVIGSFEQLGWQIETYYSSDYEDYYPIITSPSGIRTVYPLVEE